MSEKTEHGAECKNEASHLDAIKNHSTILLRARGTSTPIGANSPALELSRENSSILLSGRGTSTPIGANRPSFSCLTASDYLKGFAKARREPKINSATTPPVFGRKSVQLLSDYQKIGKESGVRRILQGHKVRQHPFNVEKTFEDVSSIAQPSSSALRGNPKKEANRNNVVNKRRSAHNDSKVPIFKVTTKRPKSPRLLTAIRAKLRANREKAKNMHSELIKEDERKKTTKKEEGCTKPMRPAQKKPPTVFNKYKITIPISPKRKQTKTSGKKL